MKIPIISKIIEEGDKGIKYWKKHLKETEEIRKKEYEYLSHYSDFISGMSRWINEAEPILKEILIDSPSAIDDFVYTTFPAISRKSATYVHKVSFKDGAYNVQYSPWNGNTIGSYTLSLDKLISNIKEYLMSIGSPKPRNKLVNLIESRTGRNLKKEVYEARE